MRQFLASLLSLSILISPCTAFQSTMGGKAVAGGNATIGSGAPAVGGSPALVGTEPSKGTCSTAATCAVTLNQSTTAGQWIAVVCFEQSGAVSPCTVPTETGGSDTFTLANVGATSRGTESGVGTDVEIWTTPSATAGIGTITCHYSGTPSSEECFVYQVTNPNSSSAIDVSGNLSSQVGANPQNGPSLTTSAANTVIIECTTGDVTAVGGTGAFTNFAPGNANLWGCANKTVTAAGTYQATFTAVATEYASSGVALK